MLSLPPVELHLFKLDFFVHHLQVFSKKRVALEYPISVGLNCNRLPNLAISRQDFAAAIGGGSSSEEDNNERVSHESNFLFHRGQSCLFSMRPKALEEIVRTERLQIGVFQVKPDLPCDDEASKASEDVAICTAKVELSQSWPKVVNASSSSRTSHSTTVYAIDNAYNLVDSENDPFGCIQIHLQLSSFGQVVSIPFALEGNSVIVKSVAACQAALKCTKVEEEIGVQESLKSSDIEMAPTIKSVIGLALLFEKNPSEVKPFDDKETSGKGRMRGGGTGEPYESATTTTTTSVRFPPLNVGRAATMYSSQSTTTKQSKLLLDCYCCCDDDDDSATNGNQQANAYIAAHLTEKLKRLEEFVDSIGKEIAGVSGPLRLMENPYVGRGKKSLPNKSQVVFPHSAFISPPVVTNNVDFSKETKERVKSSYLSRRRVSKKSLHRTQSEQLFAGNNNANANVIQQRSDQDFTKTLAMSNMSSLDGSRASEEFMTTNGHKLGGRRLTRERRRRKGNNKRTRTTRRRADIKDENDQVVAAAARSDALLPEKSGQIHQMDPRIAKRVRGLRMRNPGVNYGHRDCVDLCMTVPRNMGWQWNTFDVPGTMKPRLGWRPGAIPRLVYGLLAKAKKRRKTAAAAAAAGKVQQQDPVQNVATKLKRSNLSFASYKTLKKDAAGGAGGGVHPGAATQPTIHFHKTDGVCYIIMNPANDGPERAKPWAFRILKDADRISACSSSSRDFEFDYALPHFPEDDNARCLTKTTMADFNGQVEEREIRCALRAPSEKAKRREKQKQGSRKVAVRV